MGYSELLFVPGEDLHVRRISAKPLGAAGYPFRMPVTMFAHLFDEIFSDGVLLCLV